MAKKNNVPTPKDNTPDNTPKKDDKNPVVENDNNEDNSSDDEDFDVDAWAEEDRRKIHEEAERRRRENAALFGDLEEDDEDDGYTLEDLKDVIQKNKSLHSSVAYNKQQVAALEEEVAHSKIKIANVEKELKIEQLKVATQLVGELTPALDKLKAVATGISADARTTDKKVERLASGVEKTTLKITDSFNKFSAPLPTTDEPEKKQGMEEPDIYMAPKLPDADDYDKIDALIAEEDETTVRLTEELTALQKEALNLSRKAKENKGILERHQKTFEEEKQFAASKFIKNIIQDLDTLETSVAFLGQDIRDANPEINKIATGVENALNDVTTVFNKCGVKQINPLNQPFDENKHMAVQTEEVDGVAPETVVKVFQKGYEVNDRVIRHAKVVVTPN